MRLFKASSLLALILPATVHAGNASDFFCRTTLCVIPYDGQGVQNGTETCYNDREKKEKMKEVTWKNGMRDGPARCFEKGKVTVETNFEKNKLHGLSVEKNYDSTGDLYTRVVHGRQEGFAFSVDKDKKINFRGCWQDDHLEERAEAECLKGDYGPFTKQVLAEYKKIKDEERGQAAAAKARRDGPQIDRYRNGEVLARYTTKDGRRVGVYKEFFEDGKDALEEHYTRDGKRDGESKEWNKEGVLKRVTLYDNDSKTSETEYYDNGKPSTLTVWEGKGFERAPCLTYFYQSGKKRSSECRLPSLDYYEPLHGDYVFWNEDGSEAVKGRYDRGVRAGTWTYFAEDHKVSQEETYEKGLIKTSVLYEGGVKTTREYFPDGSIKSEKKIKTGGA